jgi:hypothetical protein
MRFLRPLQRPSSLAGLLLALGSAAATWTGCGPTSSGLPGGTWGGTLGDSNSSGSGGGDSDASASGATPGRGADAGVEPNAAQDAGAEADGPARKGDGATGPADAGMALDTGSPLTTFTLLDTSVNTIVDGEPVSGWDPIPEGSTIDLAKVGTALSIRANTTPAVVGSVLFVLDGVTMHTENAVPYTECSDNGAGTITPCVYSLGPHALVVTPYAEAGDAGSAQPSTTLYFTIVNSALDGGTDGAAE